MSWNSWRLREGGEETGGGGGVVRRERRARARGGTGTERGGSVRIGRAPDAAVAVGVDALQQRLRRGLDRLHLELAQQRARRDDLREELEQLVPIEVAVRAPVERVEDLRDQGRAVVHITRPAYLDTL